MPKLVDLALKGEIMDSIFLGIDLGGINTKIGIADPKGQLLKHTQIPTDPDEGPEKWVSRIFDEVRAWKIPFAAIGVGSPGPLDTKAGTIITTPNLKSFEGFSMKKAFENRFQVPSFFENDANCAALAEIYFGPHKGIRELVAMTLGTGVGSGVITRGKLIVGQGLATELGHMIIDMDGPPCFCGRRGCLESFVGARNTVERFKKLTKSQAEIEMKDIFDRHEKGEGTASQIIQEWVRALAVGLANVITIFNPQVVVLNGGVSRSWATTKSTLFGFLNSMVEKPILQSTLVELSQLGPFFGVQGAVALAAESWNVGSKHETVS